MAGVANGSNTECHAIQRSAIRAGFHQTETGLLGVGKDKFSPVVCPQMNNALGIVNNIPGALYLSDLIGPLGKIGKVDLPAVVGHKFLRPKAAVHGPNAEFSIGNGLGRVRAVHLHQLHAGLGVVEEKQLFCPTAGGQLNLLGGGVLDVAVVPGVHLDCPVGAGFDAGQEDLTAGVRLIVAQRNAVPENLKGDVRHGPVALPVIFHDLQSDLRQIFEDKGAGGDGVAVGVQFQLDLLDLGGGLVIGGRDQLRHGVLAGLDVLSCRLGGVPPLDALQNAVFIGVKLIDAVGDRGELERGGANAGIGIGVPFEQEGLPRLRNAAIFNAARGADLDRARRRAVLRGLAGHGEGGGQRGTACRGFGLLDIQGHTLAVLHDVRNGGAGCAVSAGGHYGQGCATARGIRIYRELRAGQGLLVLGGDFFELQVDRFLLGNSSAVGKSHLGGSAAAGKFLSGHIGCAADAGDIGQLGGVVLRHFVAEG